MSETRYSIGQMPSGGFYLYPAARESEWVMCLDHEESPEWAIYIGKHLEGEVTFTNPLLYGKPVQGLNE